MKVFLVLKRNPEKDRVYDYHICQTWDGVKKYILKDIESSINYLENTLFQGYILKPEIKKLREWKDDLENNSFPFGPAGGSEIWFTAYPKIEYYFLISKEEVGE